MYLLLFWQVNIGNHTISSRVCRVLINKTKWVINICSPTLYVRLIWHVDTGVHRIRSKVITFEKRGVWREGRRKKQVTCKEIGNIYIWFVVTCVCLLARYIMFFWELVLLYTRFSEIKRFGNPTQDSFEISEWVISLNRSEKQTTPKWVKKWNRFFKLNSNLQRWFLWPRVKQLNRYK